MTFSGHFLAIRMFIFHKTEVLTVILRCLTGLTYYWFKSYDTKHVAGQKMARYGLKKAIYQLPFFRTSPNLLGASGYIWGHNFWPNQYLDPLDTSKLPSEPQFCERYTHIWQKNGQEWSYRGHLLWNIHL
jgi:hypothetical protein